jgi:hypothetical protein
VFPHLALAEGKHLELFADRALIHFHGPRAEEYLLSSEDLAGDGIGNLIERLPSEHGLTVCSDVRLASGTTLHIPMMDFLCSPSDANENLVISLVRRLEQPRGLLANSGNSYHFYGCNLFENDEWRRFLARALLLSPITDPRYIAHRLMDGFCNLRIVDRKTSPIPNIEKTFSSDPTP